MMSREVLQIHGAKELINLIETFDALPREALDKFFNPYELHTLQTISDVTAYNYVFYDANEDIVMKYKGVSLSSVRTACFETICAMANGKRFNVAKTLLQGFDYAFIIEGDENIYQVMYFGSDGPEKLALYNTSIDSNCGYIPVFVFVNSGTEDLYRRNEKGEEYLIPNGEYYISKVSINGRTGNAIVSKEEGKTCE